jgi:hypothetical protein
MLYMPMKMEQTQCSETSAIKHHTPENNPKGYTRYIHFFLLQIYLSPSASSQLLPLPNLQCIYSDPSDPPSLNTE